MLESIVVDCSRPEIQVRFLLIITCVHYIIITAYKQALLQCTFFGSVLQKLG